MKKIWLALLWSLVFSGVISAQSAGTINGRVTDQTDAVVAGATVTATDAGTGAAHTTTTDGSGVYSLAQILTGAYNVKVTAYGFASSEKDGETLLTGSSLTVDFQLGVASTAEKVEVTTEAPMVDTTQSDVAESLQTSEVQNIPILNRNVAGMIALIPGARPTTATTNLKIAQGAGISLGGSNGRGGGALVDGADFRDETNGGMLFNQTLEGVQEFTLLAHDIPAQYGVSSGGVVLITTKSGTNRLHGSGFAFYRNQSMTAIDYFSSPANGGFGKPAYDREDWGGSLGGPILKDKLFFFAAAERIHQDQSDVWSGAEYQEAVALQKNLATLTSCPLCIQASQAIVPVSASPQQYHSTFYSARLDYQITPHNLIFFRGLRERTINYDDEIQPNGQPAHPDAGPNSSNDTDHTPGDAAILSDIWTISDKSVNTAAFTVNHYLYQITCKCTDVGPLGGILGTYINMTFPSIQTGMPHGIIAFIGGTFPFHYQDQFAHTHGNQTWTMGGFMENYGLVHAISYIGSNPNGVTWNDDAATIIGNTNGKYPQGFLTPGAMKSVVENATMLGGPTAPEVTIPKFTYAAFFQDDWKVLRRLTVNMGMRYTLYWNWQGQSIQNVNPGLAVLKSINSPYATNYSNQTKDFSPRVGFAWDVTGKGTNVIRGSYGIYFDINLGVGAGPTSNILYNQVSTYNTTAQLAKFVYGDPNLTTDLPGPALTGTSYAPGGNTSVAWYDAPRLRMPYDDQAHIGYSRTLTRNSLITADYTYILGINESGGIPSPDPTESANWDPAITLYNTCGLTGTWHRLDCQFNPIYGKGTIGGVTLSGNANISKFQELIIHFEQRSRPLTMQVNYTLSSAYAFGGGIGETGGSGGTVGADIPFQPHSQSEWGPSPADERNRFVITGVANLPWKISASPVFQITSAPPYNCLNGSDWTGSGSTTARCWISPTTGQPTLASTLEAAPFSIPAYFGQQYQTSVDSLRGTATWDLDTRVSKVFDIKEKAHVNLFAEFYNLTNKANFGNNYGGTLSSTTFEQPLGYWNNGQTLPTSRQLQVGTRITF